MNYSADENLALKFKRFNWRDRKALKELGVIYRVGRGYQLTSLGRLVVNQAAIK